MRALTLILATTALALAASPAAARMLDPAKAEDALEISKRAQCGEADGKQAVYHWSGRAYSRVEGEADRLLFKVEGMNVRQCTTVTDPQRGKGYRLVSREILLYLDPVTGEVVRNWKNPWTGETVEVVQVANDPVNSRPSFPKAHDGTAFTNANLRREGRWFFMPSEIPLFYTNPLQGGYQDFVGGKYHAMEIFDFAFDAQEMLDTKKYPTAYPIISWVRMADWLPWMKMRGRPGLVIINAMGNKLKNFDELPPLLKSEIAANYPAYTAPPPLDDTRPNETSWTVFKKWADSQPKPSEPAGHR